MSSQPLEKNNRRLFKRSVCSGFSKDALLTGNQINILARDPSVLEKQEGQVHLRESPAVTRILESALGKQRNTSAVRSSASKAPTSDQSNNGSTTSDASDEVVVVSKDNAIKQSQETKPALTFDFNSLVPPEVWGDLMPVTLSRLTRLMNEY